MLLIGYAMVSKSDDSQTVAPQRNALLVAGVDPERIYEDLASGRNDARPGLIACLKALQPGNTLVLWKLDRLGRDLRHLVNTAEDLRVRGIGLKVLTGAGAQIDTTTANGRLAFGIFAAFAEFERELIAERTQAGLAAARARGRLDGRPRKMDRAMLTIAMAALSDPKAVAADVAKRLGIRRPRFTPTSTVMVHRKPPVLFCCAPKRATNHQTRHPLSSGEHSGRRCRRSDGGDRGLAPQISGLADTTSGAPGADGLDGQALLNPQRSMKLIEEIRAA